MTSIGRRCRDGNVYSRAVLIARTLSLKPTGFERKDKRHTAKKNRIERTGVAAGDVAVDDAASEGSGGSLSESQRSEVGDDQSFEKREKRKLHFHPLFHLIRQASVERAMMTNELRWQ